jgi:hypothetical protein
MLKSKRSNEVQDQQHNFYKVFKLQKDVKFETWNVRNLSTE